MQSTGKWCLILNLSASEGASINDGIARQLCSLSYVTVDDIAAIVQLCWLKAKVHYLQKLTAEFQFTLMIICYPACGGMAAYICTLHSHLARDQLQKLFVLWWMWWNGLSDLSVSQLSQQWYIRQSTGLFRMPAAPLKSSASMQQLRLASCASENRRPIHLHANTRN